MSETSRPPPPISPPTAPTPPRRPATSAFGPSAGRRRLRRLARTLTLFRRRWTRERWLEVGKTMLWVAPLTLLMWVWAQDQQIESQPSPGLELRLTHAEPSKVVTLLDADGVAVRSDAASVRSTLVLQGPRVRLSQTLERMRAEGFGFALDAQIAAAAGDRTTLDLRDVVAGLDLFSRGGVSVIDVSPRTVEVRIEEVVDATAQVVAGGLAAEELVGTPQFDPPTVTIRGPATTLRALGDTWGDIVVVAELPADASAGENQSRVTLTLPEQAGPRVTVTPPSVVARFVRQEQVRERLTLPVVQLRIDKPAAMEGDLTVDGIPPTLTGINVEGPREIIERLRRGEETVHAYWPLNREDELRVDQTVTKQVWLRLPPDVTVRGPWPEVVGTIRRSSDPTPDL